MLVEFRVKNFRSFQEEHVFTLVASSDHLLSENTVATPALGKRKLLRSAVIYGANAAGKSNLLKAIRFVRDFIRHSVDAPPEEDIPVQPFSLDNKSRAAPTEFELTFIHEEVRYQYGFSIDSKRVHSEWLFAYPKGYAQKWVERRATDTDMEWYFGPQLKGEKARLIPLTRHNALFLSVAAKFAHEQLGHVYNWFAQQLRVVDADDTIELLLQDSAQQVYENEPFHTKVLQLLKLADLGIIDFSVKEKNRSKQQLPSNLTTELSPLLLANMRYDIQMQHRADRNRLVGVPLSITDESNGTRRLFALIAPWLSALQNGMTLWIDELDSSLHPLIVQKLVGMFHDTTLNSQNAQLIFNTHDVSLLDLSLLRRDQIWFVEKDQAGASHLYSLYDFIPRKDEALEDGYLLGRYGAIPFVDQTILRK